MQNILIIQATFNSKITSLITSDIKKTLKKNNVNSKIIQVPGALEIPQYISKILKTNHNYNGIIAVGCIIKGDTYHFEIVSNESARAIMNLSLQSEIPIINGILSTYNETQAILRAEKQSSKTNVPKGIEFAEAMIQMLKIQNL